MDHLILGAQNIKNVSISIVARRDFGLRIRIVHNVASFDSHFVMLSIIIINIQNPKFIIIILILIVEILFKLRLLCFRNIIFPSEVILVALQDLSILIEIYSFMGRSYPGMQT